MAQGVCPGFKPQHCKKIKKILKILKREESLASPLKCGLCKVL
jgi:hypothetical protein